MKGVIGSERTKVLAIGVAVLCIGAANVIISATSLDTSPLRDREASKARAASSSNPATMAYLMELDLPETLVRPIFSPTRRDFVTAPAEEASPEVPIEEVVDTPAEELPGETPKIALRGTRIVNGKRSALISGGDEAPTWLAEGEMIGEWMIKSITFDGVSMTAGNESLVLSLYQRGEDNAENAAE